MRISIIYFLKKKRDDFALGQLTAYYDVLTIFKEQAISFGIEIKDIGLDQIDENAVLLGTQKSKIGCVSEEK